MAVNPNHTSGHEQPHYYPDLYDEGEHMADTVPINSTVGFSDRQLSPPPPSLSGSYGGAASSRAFYESAGVAVYSVNREVMGQQQLRHISPDVEDHGQPQQGARAAIAYDPEDSKVPLAKRPKGSTSNTSRSGSPSAVTSMAAPSQERRELKWDDVTSEAQALTLLLAQGFGYANSTLTPWPLSMYYRPPFSSEYRSRHCTREAIPLDSLPEDHHTLLTSPCRFPHCNHKSPRGYNFSEHLHNEHYCKDENLRKEVAWILEEKGSNVLEIKAYLTCTKLRSLNHVKAFSTFHTDVRVATLAHYCGVRALGTTPAVPSLLVKQKKTKATTKKRRASGDFKEEHEYFLG